MRTNWKTEEKKMSMSKNIARLAVTAGLTAALSFGGVMAPVTMAFAEGGAGSITINKVDDANKDNTFKAYQIFKAKVVDEEGNGKVASDIKWANGTVSSKVIAAIQGSDEYKKLVEKDDTKKLDDGATAQVVAEWLFQNVTGTSASTATTGGTRVASGSVLNSIAKAVAKDETAVGSSFKAGEEWTRPDDSGDGYYLFVSDDLTEPAKPNTGTSPIFAIVGGNSVVVTEKTSIPTVEKKILDDNAGTDATNVEEKNWKNSGDAWIGQDIDYRLTGHVADNIASYDTYYYEFQDTLSKGLKVVKNSDGSLNGLHVYIVNNGTTNEVKFDKASGYDVAVTDDATTGTELLKVSFDNLKAVQSAKGNAISVDAASTVVVTYKAQLTSDAEYTATGNTNEVKLVYSNNPMTNDKGTSESDKVTDYVFGLDVTKTASDDLHKKLVAAFKVKMIKEGTTPVTGDEWLTETGGLTSNSDEAGVFRTKETTSKVFIPGLVAGEYEITECETPAGYNSISFTITVTPTYDKATGKLTKLTVKDSSDMVTSEFDKNVDSTMIPVTIQNKKGSGLPLTGLNGVTFTWIAGGAVLCIGVAHLIRSRKQAEESEQE